MDRLLKSTMLGTALLLMACPEVQETKQVDPETQVKKQEGPPATAMILIQKTYDALEANCGEKLPKMKAKNWKDLQQLEVPAADRERADALLADIGTFAQQCGSYAVEVTYPAADSCAADCSWCPVKWYWCLENAGACAGGDNTACCKLGACGSKHHCEEVCKSSCGCDVPPLPADGGGDGGD